MIPLLLEDPFWFEIRYIICQKFGYFTSLLLCNMCLHSWPARHSRLAAKSHHLVVLYHWLLNPWRFVMSRKVKSWWRYCRLLSEDVSVLQGVLKGVWSSSSESERARGPTACWLKKKQTALEGKSELHTRRAGAHSTAFIQEPFLNGVWD
jgi:hypothetical protein